MLAPCPSKEDKGNDSQHSPVNDESENFHLFDLEEENPEEPEISFLSKIILTLKSDENHVKSYIETRNLQALKDVKIENRGIFLEKYGKNNGSILHYTVDHYKPDFDDAANNVIVWIIIQFPDLLLLPDSYGELPVTVEKLLSLQYNGKDLVSYLARDEHGNTFLHKMLKVAKEDNNADIPALSTSYQ